MAFKNIDEMINKLNELRDERFSLADVLTNDGDVNDWCKMMRLGPMLTNMHYEILTYSNFMYLINKMENEKDKFEVQKCTKHHKEYFEEDIKGHIKIGRTWNFQDYRCREWQKRLEKFMCDVQDYFFVNCPK